MGSGLNQMSKFISPILERNQQISAYTALTQKERIEIIKERFNLTHGKGKRKKSRRKKK